jgi:hypothetical protein
MPGSTQRAAGRLTAALFLALVSIAGCDGEKPVDPLPPGTGVIEVAVSTSGADPDPDGYLATLDGSGTALPLPSTGSAGFLDVVVGEHTVALGGLASNCTADAASRSVTVTDGAAVTVSFTVSCIAISPTSTGLLRAVAPRNDFDYRSALSAFSALSALSAAPSVALRGGETRTILTLPQRIVPVRLCSGDPGQA